MEYICRKDKNSFVKGAAILGGAGLLVKLIGAIFRIPLTNIIGADGMANYQVAYPYYAALVVISTAGPSGRHIPHGLRAGVARRLSRRTQNISDRVQDAGDHRRHFRRRHAGRIRSACKCVLAYRLPASGLMMIAPALFFVAILSAYRGYFQGLQSMAPTAVTQIIEQLVKLGAGLFLAYLWAPIGHRIRCRWRVCWCFQFPRSVRSR